MKGVLAFSEEQLVSVDFNHNPSSAIFDTFGTKVIGSLVKILAWYDNEWGFSNRMLDVAVVWMKVEAAGGRPVETLTGLSACVVKGPLHQAHF